MSQITNAVSLAANVFSAVNEARVKQQQGAAATNNGGGAAAQTAAKPTADRDAFLTLLVSQLKNQDPLAPQDGAQFVAQLAQFNSLDQLININSRLDKLIGQK